ncbi:MAG: hypothetical protein HS127_07920 [Planctomycetia bacterium]|nr:hypothetical protein [Planctomycetia bacterium]
MKLDGWVQIKEEDRTLKIERDEEALKEHHTLMVVTQSRLILRRTRRIPIWYMNDTRI